MLDVLKAFFVFSSFNGGADISATNCTFQICIVTVILILFSCSDFKHHFHTNEHFCSFLHCKGVFPRIYETWNAIPNIPKACARGSEASGLTMYLTLAYYI